MKISFNWLKEYLDGKIASPEELAELFNVHSYEVESIEKIDDDAIFEIDVLPNRAGDSLSHRGVAKETSIVTGAPFKEREMKMVTFDTDAGLSVNIFDDKKCLRYMGRLVEYIEVKESPKWLKEKLEILGQRPINNIVDVLNYTMFDMGQPMHAFDAKKVVGAISVRLAKEGEKIETLDGKDMTLRGNDLIIADDAGPLAIAGVKGGKRAEVGMDTRSIIIESASFSQKTVRFTSRGLQIITEASKRYENNFSSELTALGMDMASGIIGELAGTSKTKFKKIVDVYPKVRGDYKLGVSLSEINKLLGIKMGKKDILSIFEKFGFDYEIKNPAVDVETEALGYLGVPYKYGASVSYDAPRFFDCSSFTSYLFANSGVSIPRISIDQFFWGQEISKNDLKPGDLIFSSNDDKGLVETREFMPGLKFPDGVGHVGVYLGEDKVIHASGKWHKGEVVVEDLTTSPAFKSIKGYRRVTGGEERFVITVPTERVDLRIKEDLIEEIGRIYGLNNIVGVLPAEMTRNVAINKILYYTETVKDVLTRCGFDEVRTYSFAEKGEVELMNPISKEIPFMRASLGSGLEKTIKQNLNNIELLGIENVSLFEVGKVFNKNGEKTSISFGVSFTNKTKSKAKEKFKKTVISLSDTLPKSNFNIKEDDDVVIAEFIGLEDLLEGLPDKKIYEWEKHNKEIKYQKISNYPYILRDIAVWLSSDNDSSKILNIINKNSAGFLRRVVLFDRFQKESRVSHAYHLVFQSNDKTLTDDEINEIMDKVYGEIKNLGFEIR